MLHIFIYPFIYTYIILDIYDYVSALLTTTKMYLDTNKMRR